ncbi:helix-turn-helix transcriptional regulator [Vagococcus salmoninarum]|uniref:helix-turn-helix transcriptional regulator n=1 Tax=Vagococcus salmoninarum TaxID=2739 RepID=UPI001476E7AE|nr:helix-turn-helix transcriptional regulator [Vagococcus salmoninarum]MBE9390439.1 helix-turn-helix transcriptional regulator [Vagococcus salmoninarum]
MNPTFADFLKNKRLISGLSQEAVANQLLITRQSVSKWETSNSIPSLEHLVLLAFLYNFEIEECLIFFK